MKITAITTFKNGALRDALLKAGMTQSDLAKKIGSHPTRISELALMKRFIGVEWLNKIQFAFGEAGVYVALEDLWPEGFDGFKRTLQTVESREIENDHLIQFYEDQQQMIAESSEIDSLYEHVSEVAEMIRPGRRSKAIKMLVEGHSLGDLQEEFGVGRERITQLIGDAARDMRRASECEQKHGQLAGSILKANAVYHGGES